MRGVIVMVLVSMGFSPVYRRSMCAACTATSGCLREPKKLMPMPAQIAVSTAGHRTEHGDDRIGQRVGDADGIDAGLRRRRSGTQRSRPAWRPDVANPAQPALRRTNTRATARRSADAHNTDGSCRCETASTSAFSGTSTASTPASKKPNSRNTEACLKMFQVCHNTWSRNSVTRLGLARHYGAS